MTGYLHFIKSDRDVQVNFIDIENQLAKLKLPTAEQLEKCYQQAIKKGGMSVSLKRTQYYMRVTRFNKEWLIENSKWLIKLKELLSVNGLSNYLSFNMCPDLDIYFYSILKRPDEPSPIGLEILAGISTKDYTPTTSLTVRFSQ